MLAALCGYGWGGPGPWLFTFPLLWLAVLAGIAFFIRRRRGPWSAPSGETVLAESFARGEITEEDYRSRIAVLRERGTAR